MKDHYPELSGKELRLQLADLQGEELDAEGALLQAKYALEGVKSKIALVEESLRARRRTNTLAETAAKREAQERGETP